MKTAAAIFCLLVAAGVQAQDKGKPSADVNRGRYLVVTGGCNDCHTPGYPAAAGKVDEKLWLTGEKLG
jgi:mono/diheme cytochrome c family protein